MDISLLIGIIIGFGALIFGFTIEGGALKALFLASPAIIVVGGTIGAVIASYSFKDIKKACKAMVASFRPQHVTSTEKIIKKIAEVADIYHKDGVKGIDGITNSPEYQSEDYLLLKEGLVLIQGLKSPEEIQYTLEADIRSFTQRKRIEISVWESAAGYSPTMGIIGTVMGLIQVLSKGFDDPAELAASIAVAFISTLYGVAFANLIYLPIASKLKSNLRRIQANREMVVDGVRMIARGERSRDVENGLSLYYQAYADGFQKYREGIDN